MCTYFVRSRDNQWRVNISLHLNSTLLQLNVIFVARRRKTCQITLLRRLPDTCFKPRLLEIYINEENNLWMEWLAKYFAYFVSHHLVLYEKLHVQYCHIILCESLCISVSCNNLQTSMIDFDKLRCEHRAFVFTKHN